MNSKKNVIVVSVRRSGTHLLTDLIVNNFGYESLDYNYIDYTEFTWPKLNGLEKFMKKGNKVTWTHAHDFKDYHKYNHTTKQKSKLDNLFSESKIILIYRDIRDVINSCYHVPRTQKKYKSFSDFYTNFDFDGYELIDQKYDDFSELLIEYYKNWFSVYMSKEIIGLDMEIISFEEIIEEYDSSVNKIGKFLEQPINNKYFRRNEIVDVRLPNENTENIIYTTNDFRSGKINDWFWTMENEFGTEIGERYHIQLGAGLECFLNDIKIHKYHRPERSRFYETDWTRKAANIESELKKYNNKFKSFNVDIKELIENRYSNCDHRGTDLRYKHKVFYYDDYLLKFIYPCKATLDKKTFNDVIPIASKELLLTILKTDDFLYENGIVPKLHYAGIYNGVLFVIQERCPSENVIYSKYNFYPKWNDWSWVVKLNLYPQMLKHINTALDNNIYNCALDSNGDLKYFDLDGIKLFNSQEEMVASEDYKNIIGILREVGQHGK